MSFRNCLQNAIEAGEIDETRAARIREILDEEIEAARREVGDAAAEDEGARRAFARLEHETLLRERRTRLQVRAVDEVRRRVEARVTGNGEGDPFAALPDLIEHHGSSPDASVASRHRAILGRAHSRMNEAIFEFERDALSRTRNRAQLDNVIREAMGESSGDEAAARLARGWTDAAEFVRTRYNEAGGDVPRLENWGMPHNWDRARVSRAGFEAWRDAVLPRLDRARMIDYDANRPLTDAELDDLVRNAWDAIVTEGWSRREPSARSGGSSLARRRDGQRRVLVFRNADDWLEVNEQFGMGDPFGAMMHYLDRMARDTAAMEILGPNPDATLSFAEQLATRNATLAAPQGTRPRVDQRQVFLMRGMWALHNGSAYAGADSTFSRVLGTAQNIKVSTQLGSAAITALSDQAYHSVARGMNGLSRQSGLQHVLGAFNPLDATHRRQAVRAGLIAEGASQVMGGQGRYVNEIAAFEWSKYLADATLRLSGLSPMTQARRWAFGMEMMGSFADFAELRYRDLNPNFRAQLARYGFEPADWDNIRRTPLYEPEPGAVLLRPEDIAEASHLDPAEADRLAMRYLEMVQTETDFAVPVASLRARAYLGAALAKGNPFVDFLIRSPTMYKSFPVSILLMYGGRSWQAGVRAGGILAVKTTIYATLLGALTLQLKEIVQGRDPRPMAGTPEQARNFWTAALLQGGGLGIFGDFLFSDASRTGGSLGGTVAGPIGDEAARSLASVQRVMTGEAEPGVEALNFIERNTPGGSIWYLRLAYERMLLDQLREEIDPEAQARFRRLERRYRRDYGQGYWWAPGEASPARAPDLGNAIAEP
tara:strand:- start:2919 stop:5399 length:2481 start_codon:yes stop_codon:yes gene_type:complete